MCPFQPIQVIGLAFLLLFYVVSEVLRWYLVGRPLGLKLGARYAEALADADRLGIAQDDAGRTLIHEGKGRKHKWGLWTGATELTGWMHLHRAEEMFVTSMSRPEVNARLIRERSTLRSLDAAGSATWGPILDRDLDSKTPAVSDDQARADLTEVMNARHRRSDENFGAYVDLVRKAVLLGVTGVLLIGGLMIVLASSIPILLAGAVGGFLSRLRRVYTTANTASDYGASWVPLLLAPLVGALTGWAGVTLIDLAVQLGVLDANLGTQFPAEACPAVTEPSAAILALALLFGFAEQLFEGFSRSLADRVSTFKAETIPPRSTE